MENADEVANLERALWNLVTSFSHRDISADIARSAGYLLPPASWSLLEHLERLGPMRVSEIAACHGIDVSSVTPRLQALEREGLVERSLDPHDRRASVISIGKAGRVALERIHQARRAILATALDADQRAQIPILIEAMERITDRLKAECR